MTNTPYVLVHSRNLTSFFFPFCFFFRFLPLFFFSTASSCHKRKLLSDIVFTCRFNFHSFFYCLPNRFDFYFCLPYSRSFPLAMFEYFLSDSYRHFRAWMLWAMLFDGDSTYSYGSVYIGHKIKNIKKNNEDIHWVFSIANIIVHVLG